MITYDNWQPQPRSDTYTTPCGRYSVERTGNERFEVYGPDGKIVDWFLTLADAKDFADGLTEESFTKAARPDVSLQRFPAKAKPPDPMMTGIAAERTKQNQ